VPVIRGTSSKFRVESDGLHVAIQLVAGGDYDGAVTEFVLNEVESTKDTGTIEQGVETLIFTDTGLGDFEQHKYLIVVEDQYLNRTISDVVSATTDSAPSVDILMPGISPPSGTYITSVTLTVTEDSEVDTYYTTDGTTPDSGDTLVSGGTITLTTSVSQLKAKSFEAGAGGRTASPVTTVGPYTIIDEEQQEEIETTELTLPMDNPPPTFKIDLRIDPDQAATYESIYGEAPTNFQALIGLAPIAYDDTGDAVLYTDSDSGHTLTVQQTGQLTLTAKFNFFGNLYIYALVDGPGYTSGWKDYKLTVTPVSRINR
jgi:hypothetical protein